MSTTVPTVSPSPSRQVAEADFRSLMSAFPTGVAVVTALDGTGHPHGMTCTSLTSVSTSPAALLACLNIHSGTLTAIRSTGSFAVNLLHARARYTAELFSSAAPDRFGRVRWRPAAGLGAPWIIDDAFAVAECVVSDSMVAGDHLVILGHVVNIVQSQDVPLLYGLRSFSAWNVGPFETAAGGSDA